MAAKGWVQQADGASPVLMLRSLPEGVSEGEIIQWAQQFDFQPRDDRGQVTGPTRKAECVKALVLHDRQLGFVQFKDIWAARAVMEQFVYDSPSIRLERQDGTSYALNLVYSDKPDIRAAGSSRRCAPGGRGADAAQRKQLQGNPLLLVVLKDLRGEWISIDELFWIFTQFGRVEKISSFEKKQKYQAVVQFTSAERAGLAMAYLNGRNLPARDGSTADPLCMLSIVPSNVGQLSFRNQDDRNRDYSEMNIFLEQLLRSDPARGGHKDLAGIAWQDLIEQRIGRRPDGPPPQFFDFIWGERVWGDGWLHPQQDAVWRGRIPPPGSLGLSEGRLGECLHVSGLPEDDSFSAEALWQLCGMYGEVRAAKLLYHHAGCAVVQMGCPAGCRAVIQHLHGATYRGRQLEVRPSRQPNAAHWGASPEQCRRLCSAQGREQPPRDLQQAVQPPSRALLAWGLPPGIGAFAVRRLIEARMQLAPAAGEDLGEGCCVVVMSHADDAVDAACALNGSWHPAPGGTGALDAHGRPLPWQLRLRFAPHQWALGQGPVRQWRPAPPQRRGSGGGRPPSPLQSPMVGPSPVGLAPSPCGGPHSSPCAGAGCGALQSPSSCSSAPPHPHPCGLPPSPGCPVPSGLGTPPCAPYPSPNSAYCHSGSPWPSPLHPRNALLEPGTPSAYSPTPGPVQCSAQLGSPATPPAGPGVPLPHPPPVMQQCAAEPRLEAPPLSGPGGGASQHGAAVIVPRTRGGPARTLLGS
eukprot:TRINITY_DN7504_c0_g1_i1.p1 TRINITY_DN7504_c0_g1~~TRINITY_DN7504_c0_g1_i1.p1  ORF type:complete len:783 (+),score=186.84 TRINITY_DN7504_c0_g1_i1:103-2349(+)